MADGNVDAFRPRVLLILAAAVSLLTPVILVASWIVVTWAGWSATLVLGGVVVSASIVLLGRAQPVDRADAERGTVWNAIPPWQYDGRHVESGGTTREEQERAVGEIRSDADALEAATERADDPDPGHPDRYR